MANNAKYLSADERRAVIVDTVLALAAEMNPAEITTAAIAGRMGLSQGALFRHFQNKDAIWEAVMARAATVLTERAESAARAGSTPMESLEALFFSHINFIVEHPGVPGFFFGELQRPGKSPARERAKELMESYGRLVGSILQEGKESGRFFEGMDIPSAAGLFVGIIQSLVLQSFLTGERETIAKRAPGVFALFRRGIERGRPE